MSERLPAHAEADRQPGPPDQGSSGHGTQPRNRAWMVAQWAAVTVVLAWIAPFAAAAFLAAIGGLVGITAIDLHGVAVSAATMALDDWMGVGAAWHAFASCCSLSVLGWRVASASPVRRGVLAIAARLDGLAGRAGRAPTTRPAGPPRSLDDSKALTRRQAVLVTAALWAGMLLAALIAGQVGQPRQDAGEPRPMTSAQAPVPSATNTSAALILRDGGIRSGHADVVKRDADTFVVSFRHDPNHQ